MDNDLTSVFRRFTLENSDEFVDGKLKICIGGGAGFIGSHLAKRLRQEVALSKLRF